MGRLSDLVAKSSTKTAEVLEEETKDGVVEVLDGRPDNIPAEVWDLIQENGELATKRLNEILTSPRFHRIRAGDQAKLIALAQNRAYGMPQSNRDNSSKRQTNASDVTQAALNALASRAALPEYRRSNNAVVEDAVIVPPKEKG